MTELWVNVPKGMERNLGLLISGFLYKFLDSFLENDTENKKENWDFTILYNKSPQHIGLINYKDSYEKIINII